MKKLLLFCTFFLLTNLSSQITDSARIPFNVKFNLQEDLNVGELLNSEGKTVDFLKYVTKNRKYKSKPTLLLFWVTYHSGGTRIIDGILEKALYEKYNLVFVNKDSQKMTTDFIQKTNEKYPLYNKHAINLYDTENIFNFSGEGVTPMLFWVDKDLKIVTSMVPVGEITTDQITQILSSVESKKILPSTIRYFDKNLVPTPEKEAVLKQMLTKKGNHANLKLVIIKTNESYYDLNFAKNAKGAYYYVKSSKTLELETKKKETIAFIQKTLEALHGKPYNSFIFSDFKFDKNSLSYKLVSRRKDREFNYSSIRWNKLQGMSVVKNDANFTHILLEFSHPIIRTGYNLSKNLTTNQIYLPVPDGKEILLQEAFQRLSDLTKQEK